MTYDIQIQNVDEQILIAVESRANVQNVAQVIPELLGEVWTFISMVGIENPGHSVVFYPSTEDGMQFFTDVGVPIEAGVEVKGAFVASNGVIASKTPAGTAATVTHVGPYQQLPEAHRAIHDARFTNGVAQITINLPDPTGRFTAIWLMISRSHTPMSTT
jgi:effector-binding domain-containing protein